MRGAGMLVSVVTPTLNSARWMHECCASVLMQQAEGVEVQHVVADGGSTDDTVAIAESYGATLAPRDPADDLETVINKATLFSSGQLVGFLGSDDVLLPGGLSALVRRYQESGCRWVIGGYYWMDAHLRPIGRVAPPPTYLPAQFQAALGWLYISHQATYMERSLFEELGGFDPGFVASGDYDFFMRAMAIAPYAAEPQAVTGYRRHGSNWSAVRTEAIEEGAEVVRRYAPSEPWKRSLYRYGMKAYVNARNPVWSYRKFRPLPPAE
ncbi:MAG TPA: glycosyltransferase [Acidimicrobiales bacterium]